MKKSKLIVRLLGGIGNQLFIYANSKALALKNNALTHQSSCKDILLKL